MSTTVSTSPPFDDTADFDDAAPGVHRPRVSPVIRNAAARWCGTTTPTQLPRRRRARHGEPEPVAAVARWCAKQGLFEVVRRASTRCAASTCRTSRFVEGDTGVIVIDPLISTETAAAALALYREHRGDRPVDAVIYTHCHVDHFGGVKGVTTQEDVDAGRVPDHRARGLRRARDLGERVRRHRDGPPRRLHVRRRAAPRPARAASAPDSARPPRPARSR